MLRPPLAADRRVVVQAAPLPRAVPRGAHVAFSASGPAAGHVFAHAAAGTVLLRVNGEAQHCTTSGARSRATSGYTVSYVRARDALVVVGGVSRQGERLHDVAVLHAPSTALHWGIKHPALPDVSSEANAHYRRCVADKRPVSALSLLFCECPIRSLPSAWRQNWTQYVSYNRWRHMRIKRFWAEPHFESVDENNLPPLSSHSATVIGSKIYLCGGKTANGAFNRQIFELFPALAHDQKREFQRQVGVVPLGMHPKKEPVMVNISSFNTHLPLVRAHDFEESPYVPTVGHAACRVGQSLVLIGG